MKRLLVVSIVTVMSAGSFGCVHCFQQTPRTRPCIPANPCCTPGVESYGAPGVITGVPSLTVPQGTAPVQVMPGPEAYSTPQ